MREQLIIVKVVGEPAPWPKKGVRIVTKRDFDPQTGSLITSHHPQVFKRKAKRHSDRWPNWERAVRAQAVEALLTHDHPVPFSKDVPIALGASFFIPRPKSVKRKFPTVIPDYDNYLYAISNLLEGILYEDDAQVVMRLPGGLFYADIGKNTGAEITVCNLESNHPLQALMAIENGMTAMWPI